MGIRSDCGSDMAPSTRPLSASSARIHNTAADAAISSYFEDRSGMLGLEGAQKVDRPLPEMVNLLLDAAHQRHQNRNVRHPTTQAYSLFNQRSGKPTSARDTSRSWSGRQSPSNIGGAALIGLEDSRSLGSFAGYSSTSVFAWGDASPQRGRGSPRPEDCPVTATPAVAAISSSLPSSSVPYFAPALTVGVGISPASNRPLHGPSPLGLTSPVGRTGQQLFPSNTPGPAGSAGAVPTSTTTAESTQPIDQAIMSKSASKTTGLSTVLAPASHFSGGASGHGRCGPATPLPRWVPGGLSSDPGCCEEAAARVEGQGREDSEHSPSGVPRGKSTSNPGSGGSLTTGPVAVAAAAGSNCAAECSRSTRQFVRSEVVARALSTWEGAELEVTCLYDSNFQAANRKGQHGVPLRVPVRQSVGAITYLYRWYCKRSTQFRGPVTAGDLPDAPAMPIENLCRSVPAGSNPSITNSPPKRKNATRPTRPISASPGGDGTGSGGGRSGGKTPAWLRKATTRRQHGGAPIVDVEAGGWDTVGSRTAAAATKSPPEDLPDPVATSSGRTLNLGVDPVISLSELVELLEDMEVVPQLATRVDVARIFHAALQASNAGTATDAERAAGSSSSSTGCPSGGGISGNTLQGNGATSSTNKNFKPQKSSSMQQLRSKHDSFVKGSSTTGTARGGGRSISASKEHPSSAATAGATAATVTFLDAWSAPSTGAGVSNRNTTKATSAPPKMPGTRPSSASRVSNPKSITSGGAATAAVAIPALAASNVIPRTQPHPEEVRFPVFKDILVRLAVAIACTTPLSLSPPASTATVSAASASKAKTVATLPASATTLSSTEANPVLAAAASSVGCSSRGWGRTMSMEEAMTAVRKLLERMQLIRGNVRALKNRLDELARFAKDAAIRSRDNRWLYVGTPSVVEASQDISIAQGVVPLPPGARPGMATKSLPGWSVLATTPAPSYLTAVLDEEDQDDTRYRPAWREFGAVALDLGVLQPGELRRCRLILNCRGPYTLSVRIDSTDAPFCDVTHVGLHSLPPGLPFQVDVTVQVYSIGEIVGELRLLYSSGQDRRERVGIIPVYGMVSTVGASIGLDGSRMWPLSAPERSRMAVKIVRERSAAAEAALAVPLVPPKRGPSPPRPSAPLSPSLTGYGNSSTMHVAQHKASTNVRWSDLSAQASKDSNANSRYGSNVGDGAGIASGTGTGSCRSSGAVGVNRMSNDGSRGNGGGSDRLPSLAGAVGGSTYNPYASLVMYGDGGAVPDREDSTASVGSGISGVGAAVPSSSPSSPSSMAAAVAAAASSPFGLSREGSEGALSMASSSKKGIQLLRSPFGPMAGELVAGVSLPAISAGTGSRSTVGGGGVAKGGAEGASPASTSAATVAAVFPDPRARGGSGTIMDAALPPFLDSAADAAATASGVARRGDVDADAHVLGGGGGTSDGVASSRNSNGEWQGASVELEGEGEEGDEEAGRGGGRPPAPSGIAGKTLDQDTGNAPDQDTATGSQSGGGRRVSAAGGPIPGGLAAEGSSPKDTRRRSFFITDAT